MLIVWCVAISAISAQEKWTWPSKNRNNVNDVYDDNFRDGDRDREFNRNRNERLEDFR